jgi:hypothetical protein
MVRLILEKGGKPDFGNTTSMLNGSALFRAFQDKNYEIAELLLENGACIEIFTWTVDNVGEENYKVYMKEYLKADRQAQALMKKYEKKRAQKK